LLTSWRVSSSEGIAEGSLEEFRSLGVQFISDQENIYTSSPLGQALFTIVSAVAQLERDLIWERVSAGVRNARACGKQLGRPRRIVNADELLHLKTEGASLRQIAEKTMPQVSAQL
jgi:DNA invertase Pin-like site-specific DNA recombinase